MEFPQYRKRFDDKSFYKIINERTFEEVQLIGEKVFLHELTATKYFEIILVQDILANKDGMYEPISSDVYEGVRNRLF